MSKGAPRPRIVLLAIVPLLAIYALASIRHLDRADRQYVIDAPLLPLAPRSVPPGRYFVPRFLARVSLYPAATEVLRVPLQGQGAAVSREGARLNLEITLRYTLDSTRLLVLHARHGPGFETWLRGVVQTAAGAWVREASYDSLRDRDPDLTRDLRSSLQGRTQEDGIRIGRVQFDLAALEGQSSSAILKSGVPPVERRLVLIGIDSFDWRMIEPLMKQGRMPNLKRLIAGGTRAHLRTLRPILSPVIWTSIATGVKPARHGIVDFVVAGRDSGDLLPVTSAMRRVPALWTLLGQQGVDVDVVAWWATWPAETIRGRIVTDRVAYQLFEESIRQDWQSRDPAAARGKTYPPGLLDEVRSLIRAPAEIKDRELEPFFPPGTPLHDLPPERLELIDSFRTVIAAGETYHGIARRLLRPEPGVPTPPSRLQMIYYEGPDTTSHLFMRYRPPLLAGVNRQDMEMFGRVVDRYYERQDRLVGEILDEAGPQATILLVSDHGFKSDQNRPPHSDPRIGKGDAAEWHTPLGVFILAGPDVRVGADLGTVSVLDVAPTVLALFGLPVPRDMDGQPVTQALGDDFLKTHPVTWIDTYGGARSGDPDPGAAQGVDDPEIVEKLRNLGYIGEDRLTAHNNRGLIALEDGDVDRAIADFEKALDTSGPAGVMVRVNLASAWLRKVDLKKATSYAEEALRMDEHCKQAETILATVATKLADGRAAELHLRKAVAIDPTFVQARSQLGRLYEQRGDDEAALAEYREVIRIAPLSPIEHNHMGDIYRRRGQVDKAMEAYREALRCDAQYIGAYNNLGLCLQEKGRLREARDLYEKALVIRPENPILRNSLGTLLALLGDRTSALQQFERAVRGDPDWAVAQGNLANLLYQEGRYQEATSAYERWVKLSPDSEEARLQFALALLTVKDWGRAATQFEEVLNRDPRDLKARVGLAEALRRQGDLAGAQSHLEEALRLDGDVPRICNSLAEIYVERGRKDEARRLYLRSLRLDPRQAEIRERLNALGR